MVEVVIKGDPKEVVEFIGRMNLKQTSLSAPKAIGRVISFHHLENAKASKTDDSEKERLFPKGRRRIDYRSFLGQNLNDYVFSLHKAGEDYESICAGILRFGRITKPRYVTKVRRSVRFVFSDYGIPTGAKTEKAPKTALDLYKTANSAPLGQPDNQELTEQARLMGKRGIRFKYFLGTSLYNFIMNKRGEGKDRETIISELEKALGATKTKTKFAIRRAVKNVYSNERLS